MLGAIAAVVCFTGRILKNLCESLVMIGYSIYDEAREYPRRVIFLVFLVFVIAVLIVHPARAANTFALNKPIPEESLFCFDREAAQAVALAPTDVNVAVSLFRNGRCIIAKAVVIYTKRVYDNGTLRVYEGTIGKVQIYAPTDWKAESEVDI